MRFVLAWIFLFQPNVNPEVLIIGPDQVRYQMQLEDDYYFVGCPVHEDEAREYFDRWVGNGANLPDPCIEKIN